MKSSEIQVVRTSGALVSVSLVILCAVVVATAWSRETDTREKDKALKKAEVVGYQIAQLIRESIEKDELKSRSSEGRGPASAEPSELEEFRKVGTMSMDPWGQPYQYRLLSADIKGPIQILVWSAGPNKTIETPELKNEEAILKLEQHSFRGDDLGISLDL